MCIIISISCSVCANLLFCVCYSNSVSFIELLIGVSAYMVKLVLKYCVQKELLNLKDSKLTQNFYGNKTGFVRPGHIFTFSTKLSRVARPDRLGAKCYLFFSEGAVFILVAIMPYAEKAVGLCKTTCFLP